MLQAKIILPALLAGLTFVVSNTVQGLPATGCRGGGYVELETFWAKTQDDWSERCFARTFLANNNCHDFRLQHRNLDWGYRVALGYDFKSCSPCHYWGASLEYTHFDTDQNATIPNGENILPTLGSINFGLFSSANSHLDTQYNAIDVLAHYHLINACCLQTDLFLGARYARIREKLNADYSLVANFPALDATAQDLNVSFNRDLNAVGPEVGLGVYFPFYACLGLAGQVSGSYLHGDRNNRHFENFNLNIVDTNSDAFTSEAFNCVRDRRWVPAVSAHLGLAYQVTFCNCSTLKLEAGYRYDVYFNALGNNMVTCDGAARGSHTNNQVNNFEFQGPYAKLTWHI